MRKVIEYQLTQAGQDSKNESETKDLFRKSYRSEPE